MSASNSNGFKVSHCVASICLIAAAQGIILGFLYLDLLLGEKHFLGSFPVVDLKYEQSTIVNLDPKNPSVATFPSFIAIVKTDRDFLEISISAEQWRNLQKGSLLPLYQHRGLLFDYGIRAKLPED
jgi:hypothetical protein